MALTQYISKGIVFPTGRIKVLSIHRVSTRNFPENKKKGILLVSEQWS